MIVKEDNPVLEEKKEKSSESSKTKTKTKASSTKRGKKLSTVEGIKFSKEHNLLEDNIYIIFVECESPGNVGFLARVMANFGLKNLVLINPCKLKDESFYQAMHAKSIVENAVKSATYPTLKDFFKTQEINFIVGTTGTPGGSYNLSRIPIKPQELVKSMNLNSKIAILFGREGNGLSNEEINMCDIIVSIPTDPSYPIMNVSHAAAIICYELFKNKNEFPVEGLEEANNIEKELLLKDMDEIIKELNIPTHKEKTALKSFKNIINRAFITGREAHTLKGILRRILMKFK